MANGKRPRNRLVKKEGNEMRNEWKSLLIESNLIETSTDKAVLIKMPSRSDYAGYMFWHPAKLVRTANRSNLRTVSYTDSFQITIKKYGNGKTNKNEVLSEKVITIQQFEEAFGVTNDDEEESYLIVEEPTKVNKEVEVAKELINE